ncbi:hypothetical protein ACA910_019074 [Epithemia clementina (nom. ined.)]
MSTNQPTDESLRAQDKHIPFSSEQQQEIVEAERRDDDKDERKPSKSEENNRVSQESEQQGVAGITTAGEDDHDENDDKNSIAKHEDDDDNASGDSDKDESGARNLDVTVEVDKDSAGEEQEEEDEDDDNGRNLKNTVHVNDDDDNGSEDNQSNNDDEDEGNTSQNSDSSDSEGKGDNEDEENGAGDGGDGTGLSEYEKLRLERIKRNRQYLAQLGLEKTNTMISQQQKQSKKRPRSTVAPLPPRRSSLSRRTKSEKINYALPSSIYFGVDAVNTKTNSSVGSSEQNNPKKNAIVENAPKAPASTTEEGVAVKAGEPVTTKPVTSTDEKESRPDSGDGGVAADSSTNDHNKEEKGRKSLSAQERMDINVHREFIRIRASKRNALKLAKKCRSKAEKEVRYWTRVYEAHTRKMERIRKLKAEQEAKEQEMRALGGVTMRDLLQEIDRRMPLELHLAAIKYDNQHKNALLAYERKRQEAKNRQRILLLRSFEEFPKAMNAARTILNTILLERSPKDPPPPRRSKRTAEDDDDDQENDTTTNNNKDNENGHQKDDTNTNNNKVNENRQSPLKRKRGRPRGSVKKPKITQHDDATTVPSSVVDSFTIYSAANIPVQSENIDGDDDEAADGRDDNDEQSLGGETEEKTAKTKVKSTPKLQRKPKAKIVGGWISPDFAQRLDRQWLIRTHQQQLQLLQQQHQNDNMSLLRLFVPQKGDIVLYYPLGHKAFLEDFPDILGKKTHQFKRVPLWERMTSKTAQRLQARWTREKAAAGNANSASDPASPSTESSWYTQEWIDSILRYGKEEERDDDDDKDQQPVLSVAHCPILCFVHGTCPEFPPDPRKVSKKQQKEDGTQEIVFDSKKGSPAKGVKKTKKPYTPAKLRLAVTLRPLTRIFFDDMTNGADSFAVPSKLPPMFSVVTFPSPSHRPFLVPFAWSYNITQELQIGDLVTNTGNASVSRECKITSFHSHIKSTEDGDRPLSSGDRVKRMMRHFLHRFDGNIKAAFEADTEVGVHIPPGDVAAVLKTLDELSCNIEGTKPGGENADDPKHPSPPLPPATIPPMSLWKIICCSLPLWDSVSLSKSYIKCEEELRASPWELTPLVSKRASTATAPLSPNAGMKHHDFGLNSIDESLRKMLVDALKQLIRDHPSAALFVDEVTDAMAPSYSCAIPVSMFFNRIFARLGSGGNGGAPSLQSNQGSNLSSSSCHYRSVGALLADIALIRENCLLYNNPEADVVEKALEIVAAAKELIPKVVRLHNRGVTEIRIADQERRRRVKLHCGRTTASPCSSFSQVQQYDHNSSGVKSAVTVCRVKHPFTEEIFHEWTEQIHLPLDKCLGNSNDIGDRDTTYEDIATSWIPQAGDKILYSRKRHAKFVMAHYPSLETVQCTVVPAGKENTDIDKNSAVAVSIDVKGHETDNNSQQGAVRNTDRSQDNICPEEGKTIVESISGPVAILSVEDEKIQATGKQTSDDHQLAATTKDKEEQSKINQTCIAEPKEDVASSGKAFASTDKTQDANLNHQPPRTSSKGEEARTTLASVADCTVDINSTIAGSAPSKDQNGAECLANHVTDQEIAKHGLSTETREGVHEDVPLRDDLQVGTPNIENLGASSTSNNASPSHRLCEEKGDIPSEAQDQSTALQTRREQSTDEDDWEGAVVRWTRASFPKMQSKKSSEDAPTFSTSATLLAVGVYFESTRKLETIYWRPCLFRFDKHDDSHSFEECKCPACGLRVSESFLRASACSSSRSPPKLSGLAVLSINQPGLSVEETGSLHRCLSLLKRKCLRGITPDSFDERLTKRNITEGYVPPQAKIGMKSLPSFADLILKRRNVQGFHGTRKQGHRQPLIDDHLLSRGYVPPWLESNGYDAPATVPRWTESISPWPSLSLELVLLRLEAGYYRHREAVENDIIEAFASICFLLLGRDAGRKKGPVSMKRVARHLSAVKSNGKPLSITGTAAKTPEEVMWVAKIEKVRELYATALVCVSNTQIVERLFGLESKTPEEPYSLEEPPPSEDPVRAEARKKLDHLLRAFGKDSLTNRNFVDSAGKIQGRRLKVVCENETVSVERHFERITRVPAVMFGKDVSVKVVLDNKEIIFLNKARSSDTVEVLSKEGESIKIVVVCDGERLSVPLIPPSSALTLNVEAIQFEESDFEVSEPLAQFFFQRIGRRNPCARCLAFRRPFISCRVRRGHSNCDFDWVEFFSGIGSIDKLLLQLDPTHQFPSHPPNVATPAAKPTVAIKNVDDLTRPAAVFKSGSPQQSACVKSGDDSHSIFSCTAHGGRARDESQEKGDDQGQESKKGSTGKNGQNDQTNQEESDTEEMDPAAVLEKAQSLLTQAENILADAQDFSSSPDIMSREFIESAIPIDQEDGHYVYCIICGHIGDLLCCDGCANVVHSKCVNLSEVPDGEWFCEECLMVKQATKSAASSVPNQTNEAHLRQRKRLPFGRSDFDPEVVSELDVLLEELFQANPERKASQSKPTSAQNGQSTIGVRSGLKTPFDALSSTTRKFLNSIGINSAEELVSSPTTKVGLAFRDWRKSMGMNEMKTSGEIASVSMWKRACRNAAEGMGVILRGDSGSGAAQNEDTESSEEEESDGEEDQSNKPKREAAARGRSFADLDDPIDALSAMAKEFFRSIGVETGDKVMEMKTSEVAKKFGKWRKRKKLPKLKGSGTVATISAWKTTCRSAVEAMKEEARARKEKSLVSPRSKRALERSRNAGASPTTPQPENIDQGKKRGVQSKTSIEMIERVASSNVLDVLSKQARDFLRSVNIESAEQFLKKRNCDIAEQLAKWRQEQGLPKLRGSGNGATISAWRSLCRNALEALEGSESSENEEVEENSEEVQNDVKPNIVKETEDQSPMDDPEDFEEALSDDAENDEEGLSDEENEDMVDGDEEKDDEEENDEEDENDIAEVEKDNEDDDNEDDNEDDDNDNEDDDNEDDDNEDDDNEDDDNEDDDNEDDDNDNRDNGDEGSDEADEQKKDDQYGSEVEGKKESDAVLSDSELEGWSPPRKKRKKDGVAKRRSPRRMAGAVEEVVHAG